MPEDNRVLETWLGLSFLLVGGGSVGTDLVAPAFDIDTTIPNIIIVLTALTSLYDLLRGISFFFLNKIAMDMEITFSCQF